MKTPIHFALSRPGLNISVSPLTDLSLAERKLNMWKQRYPKPKVRKLHDVGVVVWWSTCRQRWNVTPWTGYDRLDQRETDIRYRRKPILSDKQLLKVTNKAGERQFPDSMGMAFVVEPGYSAIWATSRENKAFLEGRVDHLVHNEA